MTITTIKDERFSATFIGNGYKEWGQGGEMGIFFHCTNSIIWKPLSEVKEIEMEDGTKFTVSYIGRNTESEKIQYLGKMLTATMVEDRDRLNSIIKDLQAIANPERASQV